MKAFVVALTAGLLSGGTGAAAVTADDEVKVVEGVPATVVVEEVDDSEETSDAKADASAEAGAVTAAGGHSDAAEHSGAYSIEVHSTSESTDESGDGDEPNVKASAKVIVVGPDGKRKVYNLEGADARAFKLNLDGEEGAKAAIERLQDVLIMKADDESGAAAVAESGEEEERFMIGVQCDAVEEPLRSHLKLGDHGLIVMEVREETPAQEAGIQSNDIIIAIDDKELTSRDDLVSSVMESEGKPLALTIIRNGDKQTVTVTPRKMKVPVVVAPATVEGIELHGLEGLDGLHGLNAEILEKLPAEIREKLEAGKAGVKVRRIHPGVIVEEGMPADRAEVNKLVERIRKEAQGKAAEARRHAEEASAQAHKAHADASAHAEQLHDTLIHLQKQMEAMRAQMEEMQKQLEKSKSEDR